MFDQRESVTYVYDAKSLEQPCDKGQAGRSLKEILLMQTAARSILIAEDAHVIGQVLQRNLELEGFEVVVAQNGSQALQALDTHQFDLVISDFQMPDINGDELCRRIRASERHANVPIAFCTAKAFEFDNDELITELGISHVFLKPFSVREVLEFAHKSTERTCATAS